MSLSNEAMYHKTWSSFVDGAISKHQRRERDGCAEGEGSVGAGRFELRDVMCLEEVLAKLEDAEGGWIDYERSRNAESQGGDCMESEIRSLGPASDILLGKNNRKSLQNTTPGLPPMFENPRPSFFASMYSNPASFQDIGQGGPLPPKVGSRRTDPCVPLRNPEHRLPASPAGTKQEGQRLTPRGGSQDGRGIGAKKSALVPMSETDDSEQHGVDDPSTMGLQECSIVSGGRIDNNGRVVSVPEHEGRDSPASVLAVLDAACPISPEMAPKFTGPLRLPGPTAAPPPVACILPEPARRGAMEALVAGEKEEAHEREPGQQAQSGDACDGSVQAAASSDQLGVAVAEGQARIRRTRGGHEEEGTDLFLEAEEERWGATQQVAPAPGTPSQQSQSFREDLVLSQLSARLSATRINEATGGDGGVLAARPDEHRPENRLRSPRQLDFERKVMAAATEGSGQALLDGGVPASSSQNSSVHDHNTSIGSGHDASPPAAFREAGGGTAIVGSTHAGGLAAPEGPRRESGDDEDDHARARSNTESPEMVRRGSASQGTDRARRRDRSFDSESWGLGASDGQLAGGGVRCSKENEDGMFSLAQSPDGAPSSARERDSQAFGSMLSPAIGGFGSIDGGRGVDSLSPLALSRSSSDVSGESCGGDDDVGGCCCRGPFTVEGRGDYGGLSPVVSARSDTTIESDGGPPSPSQRPKKVPFAEEAQDGDGDGNGDQDITLTPEASRPSGSTSPQLHSATSSGEAGTEGDRGRGSLEAGPEVEGVGLGLMPPPPPRQPSFTPRRKEQRQGQPEDPEARRFLPSARRGRTAFKDRTNTTAGHRGEHSGDEESMPGHLSVVQCGGGGGGCGERVEQVSIGSFSESEAGGSRLESSFLGGGGGLDLENAHDSSLVECTPRRQRVESRVDLGGFYPPLQVANIANKEAKDMPGLSALQRSTVQWMLWREGSGEEGGRGGGGTPVAAVAATAAAVSFSSDVSDTSVAVNIKGGVLGHLSSEEASRCVHALLRENPASGGAAGEKADSKRARPVHPVTGLPLGATLIIAPTKEAAWQWSNRLESGVDGLSVLSYVMPLRERRRLSAKQAAAFDVVVTTYDVLKAKEVPRGVEVKQATSPRIWALPGSKQWRTRNTKEEGKRKPAAASKTDHMVSLLHGVWWDRVVADGAQLLGNQRSARAVAASALVGTARWCVVERENMEAVENTSERMRCLTAFLRIPAEVAIVQAAENLFYRSRPARVAPLHPRRSAGASDNSLSLSEGDVGQSSLGSSRREGRPPSRTGTSGGRRKGKAAGLSATHENGGAGKRESRGSTGSRRGSSRVGAGSSKSVQSERYGGSGGVGGRAAAEGALTRGDVEYTATKLRLRRARG